MRGALYAVGRGAGGAEMGTGVHPVRAGRAEGNRAGGTPVLVDDTQQPVQRNHANPFMLGKEQLGDYLLDPS